MSDEVKESQKSPDRKITMKEVTEIMAEAVGAEVPKAAVPRFAPPPSSTPKEPDAPELRVGAETKPDPTAPPVEEPSKEEYLVIRFPQNEGPEASDDFGGPFGPDARGVEASPDEETAPVATETQAEPEPESEPPAAPKPMMERALAWLGLKRIPETAPPDKLDEFLNKVVEEIGVDFPRRGAQIDVEVEGPESGIVTVSAPKVEPEALPRIVEFRGVTKIYGKGKDAFTAVKDINFIVEDIPDKGEFISILGPSGCGKSTILRMIAGLTPQHPPTHGEVLVDGKPVLGPSSSRGMVFQDYTSFDHKTVLANVAFGLECQGMPRKEREDQAKDWINKVGLNVVTDAKKYPHELSGGMRQRVAIARTLALHPSIILMDEPFGALDPSTRMNMQNLLVELWRELEATVFFITHSIEEAVYLGDRIHLLSSSPGTILREIQVPPPDLPAKEMQSKPSFMEYVFDIRDTIETLESSTRAGDD